MCNKQDMCTGALTDNAMGGQGSGYFKHIEYISNIESISNVSHKSINMLANALHCNGWTLER